MSYVTGGWKEYYGWDAITQISYMIGATYTFVQTAIGVIAAATACGATGGGAAVGILLALGGSVILAAGGFNAAVAATAIMLFLRDGGFRATSYGFLFWSVYLVEAL